MVASGRLRFMYLCVPARCGPVVASAVLSAIAQQVHLGDCTANLRTNSMDFRGFD